MSAATSIDDLQQRLSNLKPGANYLDVLAALRPPESAALAEARRRCALVRSFDAELYEFLTQDLEGSPRLEEILEAGDAQQFGDGRWVLSDAVRTPLLRSWQSEKTSDWKAWNQKIAGFFLKRGRPDERLDALYHLAACPSPDAGSEYFEKWYAEADEAFDLAQCNALLEILKLQESYRGNRLTADWQSYRQYYQARVLYGDEYFKTGAYFQREIALREFEPFLQPGAKQWIFHIHATGGTGKTMFLRWLASRYLVPKRIPCAQVDLDDFSLSKVLEYPGMLFARAIDQWAEQVPGFSDLRARLQRELDQPDWNPAVPAEIGRQIRGAQLNKHLVLILDTLEDVTRTAQGWLKKGIERLGELRKLHPRLVVILSGRYDIATVTDALPAGEFVSFELPRFSSDEAHTYLDRRGIRPGETRDAIVERAGEDSEPDARDDKLKGRNPFKLAMFAELALNNPDLSPDDVRGLPRVDIAYLIERVVMRISSQPLRWAIRYGVIARHFDKRFVDAVLLPSLRVALRGGSADQANDKIPPKYGAVWKSQAELAESITADEIWTQLKGYARDRGWISLIGTEADNNEELRFHPDVVTPMRELLRKEPVFGELQERAAEYFEKRSRLFGNESLRDIVPLLSLPDAMEAAYHRFQRSGPAAQRYWQQTLRRIESVMGPAHAIAYAAEVTGRDYATEQVRPLEDVSSPEVLAAAHREVADLMLQAAGLEFSTRGKAYTDFRRRVDWGSFVCEQYHLDPLPRYLTAIRDAGHPKVSVSIMRLQNALQKAGSDRERSFLTVALAQLQATESPQDAARSYESLFDLIPRAGPTGIRSFDVAMKMADLYQQLGQHAGVKRSLDRAGEYAAQDPASASMIALRRAAYSFDVDDIAGAADGLEALEALPEDDRMPQAILERLRIRLDLARGDPFRVSVEAGNERPGLNISRRAELKEASGIARAAKLDLNGAFDDWETAAVLHDQMNSSTQAARCALLAAHLKAFGCGKIYDALSMVEGSAHLRGIKDQEVFSEFRLLEAYCHYRRGQPQQARAALDRLRGTQCRLKPLARARISTFGLIFGLDTSDESRLSALADIALLDPPSIRGRLLDWCEYSEARLDLPKDMVNRLETLFELHSDGVVSLSTRFGRAHLMRLLGQESRAASYLNRCQSHEPTRLSVGGAFEHWLTQRALLRLGATTSFRDLLGELAEPAGKPAIPLPLFDAFVVEAALEAARNGDQDSARTIALMRHPFELLASQGMTAWTARIEEVTRYAIEGEPTGSSADSTAKFFEELGDQVKADLIREIAAQPGRGERARKLQREPRLPPMAAPPPPGVPASAGAEPPSFSAGGAVFAPAIDPPEPDILTVNISMGGPYPIPERLVAISRSNEHAIDMILDDWKGVAGDISNYLGRAIDFSRPYVCLELSEPEVALPWEFAAMLTECGKFWRKGTMPFHRFVAAKSENRVLLIRPRQGSGDISFESASGGSLEGVYEAFGGRFSLAVMHDPHPDEVMKMLPEFRPDTIHIVATMREASGGLYLDFSTSEARADEYVTRRGGSVEQRIRTRSANTLGRDLAWSTTRLARILQSYRPIDMILDIAASANLAESVRMLLLRNRFAGQLFQLAPLRTLLASGLAHDAERLGLTYKMLERRIIGGTFGALHALREGEHHDDLVRVLPRLGAALWAHGPDESLSPG